MLGCTPATATTPPGEPTTTATPTQPEGPVASDASPRYVMLWNDATLASGLDETADTARASDSRHDGPGTERFWIFEHVATHGAWLEVETVETEGSHQCEPALPGLDGYALRLYVRAEQTATVTRREVTVTVAGGNRVTLSPGVRVVPAAHEDEPGLVMVDPPLPLRLPQDAIGRDYAPPLRYDEGEAVGSVGPDALRLTDEIRLPDRLGWAVLAREVQGPLTVITVADPCVRYQLHVPTAAVNEAGGIGYGSGSGRGAAPRYSIPGHAPIYWSNGERAGETRYEVRRSDEPTRREVGRVCFAHAVMSRAKGSDPTLLLCFDELDVHALESAAPSDRAEPVGRTRALTP